MRSRIILAVLIAVGLVATVAKVNQSEGYTASDALIDIGTQALPAALVFLLIDRAIVSHGDQRERRLQLERDLRSPGPKDADFLGSLAIKKQIKLGSVQGTDLSDTALVGMTLLDTTFSDVEIERCSMEDCHWRNTHFLRVNLDGSTFDKTNFHGVVFDECQLRGVLFKRCDFVDVRVSGGRIDGARFIECILPEEFARTAAGPDVYFEKCGLNTATVDAVRAVGAEVRQ